MPQYSDYMPKFTANGKEYLNVFKSKFRNIKYLVQTSKVIVIDESTSANLPTLAYLYLEDTSLWWALLYFNGLRDPWADVKVGFKLRIPNLQQLNALLESQTDYSGSSVTRL